jgi:hypothetical protein
MSKEEALDDIKNEYKQGILKAVSHLRQNHSQDHMRFEQGFLTTQEHMLKPYEEGIARVKEHFHFCRENTTISIRQSMKIRHARSYRAIAGAI